MVSMGLHTMYVAKEAAEFLNTAYEEFNAISLHLGNGQVQQPFKRVKAWKLLWG